MGSSPSSKHGHAAGGSGRLEGITTPRLFTPPLRRLTRSTSLGFDAVDFAEQVAGVQLLPWQRWLLIHALELRPGGLYRFRTVVVLVGRQNGKSKLAQVLALWHMFVLHSDLVIGTAQDLDIAEELWQGAVDLVEETPALRPRLDRVVRVNGKKSLELKSGERYKVKAANRRAGRGLSGDLVLLDELREHQSWDAWAAVVKTTTARAEAQTWALSNAGDSASIVLRHLRMRGHAALGDPDRIVQPDDVPDDVDVESTSLGLFEWSAPPGAPIDDRRGWAQANPALGYLIAESTIRSFLGDEPEWIFRAESLCQWADGLVEGPFPAGAWEACRTDVPWDGDTMAVCVDVSWDRSRSHVAMAGRRADGRTHVEVMASRAGTDWVRGWLFERGYRRVVVQSRGAPASSLLAEFAEAAPDGEPWVEVVDWSGADIGRASGAFYDLVVEHALTHLDQPVLDVAAGIAATRPLGDAWGWDRKRSPRDVAPLVAVTGAVFGLARLETPAVSAYETGELEMI